MADENLNSEEQSTENELNIPGVDTNRDGDVSAEEISEYLNSFSGAFARGVENPPGENQIEKDIGIPTTFGINVVIQKLALRIIDGSEIDLKPVMGTVMFSEQLFNHAVQGTIEIDDKYGGLEKFLIRGGENIILKISKVNSEGGQNPPGPILIYREDFIVYKISKHDIDFLSQAAKYTLFFTTRTFAESFKKNVFNSYTGPASNIARKIYAEMSVNNLIVNDPNLTVSRDKPFLVTGMNPHKALDALAKRCSGPRRHVVFFETAVPITGQFPTGQPFAGSHYFGSIESILDDAERYPIYQIFYSTKIKSDVEGKYLRASLVQRGDNFNHLSALKLGYHRTEFTMLDILRRKKGTIAINNDEPDFLSMVRDFYRSDFLDKNNPFLINPKKAGYTGSVGNRRMFTIWGQDNEYGPEFVSKGEWYPANMLNEMSRQYFTMYADIQGGTNNITVGHVVDLNLPSAFEKIAQPELGIPAMDKVYSGRYFVIGVTHAISTGKYIKRLHLARGTSKVDYDIILNHFSGNLYQDGSGQVGFSDIYGDPTNLPPPPTFTLD